MMNHKQQQHLLQKDIDQLKKVKQFYTYVLFALTVMSLAISISTLALICFP